MQLRFTSTSGDAANLGDLLVLVAFYVVQNENLSGTLRQLFHCRRYVHSVTVTRSDRRLLQRCLPIFRFILDCSPSRSCLVLPIGQDDVHCDPVNPCRELRFTSELRQLFPCSHKHILRQLLASNPVSTHPGTK